jgi:hypothetical protein
LTVTTGASDIDTMPPAARSVTKIGPIVWPVILCVNRRPGDIIGTPGLGRFFWDNQTFYAKMGLG